MPPAGYFYPYPLLSWQEIQVDLVSISISGPDSVYENGTANYTCTATYSDSSTQDVTDEVSWSVSDPCTATIDGSGILTTYEIAASRSITVSAQYEDQNAYKQVTVEAVIPDVTGMLLPQADLVLGQNNLSVGQIAITYVGGTDKYSVVSQDPAAGIPVEAFQAVDVVIYLGEECLEYFESDITGDCVVNLLDLAKVCNEWLNDASGQ